VAGKGPLAAMVVLWVLVVTVACVPLSPCGWLPFGSGDGCGDILDEDTLNRLRLSMDPSIEMRPGETREFSVGVVECCYVFEPVDACVTWSVDPADGATIDADTGRFAVAPDTLSGEVFTVSADVEEGRRLVSVEVYVYTPEADPLVGIWQEQAQLACGTFEDLEPEERIGELRFSADGTFSVTWTPFEIYEDYWGSYQYAAEEGSLELTIEGGNYVPDDVDGSGTCLIDEQGHLLLKDMWLGSPYGSSSVTHCGHRFVR
jgi:hypothetical protein